MSGKEELTVGRYDSVFDLSAWRLESKRFTAAACALAFAWALCTTGGPGQAVGLALIVEVAVLCLPWRVPRSRRSPLGFWGESLVGLVAPAAAVAVGVATDAPWLSAGAAWCWYPVAGAVGLGLVLIGGIDLRALVSGELAFLLGPTPRAQGSARAFNAAVGLAGEEALFRAPVLTGGAPLGLLAAVAFVACHHVSAGTNRRGSTRSALVEITAAGALLALTAASGSLYPALLAHLLNNLPSVVLEIQRAAPEKE